MKRDQKRMANIVAAKLYGLVGSPIEMVLATTMFGRLSTFYADWSCWIYSNSEFDAIARDEMRYGKSLIGLVPQFNITDVGRVDFALFVPAIETNIPYVAVECDGHDFHEKTKDQASRDKKRDRVLARMDVPCLRFTGTDIIRDADGAANEIVELFHQRAQKFEERWWREIGDKINKPGQGGVYVPYQWPRTRLDGKR